jgi:hypothetical protein
MEIYSLGFIAHSIRVNILLINKEHSFKNKRSDFV